MATVIKPTAISNFKSKATANSKWMIVVGANYSIAAFEDNTRIFRNGSLDTTLNRQEVSTRTYSTGDVISTDVGKGFSFVGQLGGKTGKLVNTIQLGFVLVAKKLSNILI